MVKLIKADGTLAAEYSYDAWGEAITKRGAMASTNPLRYRGYYYDSETGFYYLQSRYYDPATHRFINADSFASTDTDDPIAANMFAYCKNDPVGRIDEAGTWSWKGAFKVLAAAVTVVAVTAVCVATAGTAAVALGASTAVATAVACSRWRSCWNLRNNNSSAGERRKQS